MIDEDLNRIALQNELDWLEKVIDQVIRTYLMQEGHEKDWRDIELPQPVESSYFKCIEDWQLTYYDRVALALTLAPNLRPDALDIFFGKNALYDRPFSEFGGFLSNDFSGFLPTVQTLSFIITGNKTDKNDDFLKVLSRENYLVREQVIDVLATADHIPAKAAVLALNERWLHFFETGEELPIEQSTTFPAQKIDTKLNWDDLVLDDAVSDQLEDIIGWLEHGEELMENWNLSKKIKPGYRALFYGPPGTGKTLTTSLLGKITGRDVYRVDLSMIISKYIGETEKNLARIFDIAQYKNWILFFDEADSLFGKRTATTSSNDRHANQQTGYLLQRIEDFPGVVILASNLKENMDEAFSRRFQAMVQFNMPDVHDRHLLWQNAFEGSCQLAADVDLYQLAEDYEIAGGSIINVLRYCAIRAVKRPDNVVYKEDVLEGLRREFKKVNKTLTISN